jgi:hypothetical protein
VPADLVTDDARFVLKAGYSPDVSKMKLQTQAKGAKTKALGSGKMIQEDKNAKF